MVNAKEVDVGRKTGPSVLGDTKVTCNKGESEIKAAVSAQGSHV